MKVVICGGFIRLFRFAFGLALARLPEPGVETVPTNVGGAGQHLVDGANAPASPVPCTDACLIEVGRDRLHPHWPRGAVALPGEAEDQSHGLGLDGVDFQGFLGAITVLLAGFNDTVADRRQ